MQSGSPRHAFASAQQLVPKHALQAASPLSNPQLVPGGPPGGGPPPHALEQLDSTHRATFSRSAAPVGCADKQAEMQASLVHAFPQVMSAVQSASPTHAVLSAQQLAPRQESQVASPDESPQAPLPERKPPRPLPAPPPPPRPPSLLESAATAAALPSGRERDSFGRHSPAPAFAGVVVVSFIEQA
jgi:hypothetical protein